MEHVDRRPAERVAVVIPVYNEQDLLLEFHGRLRATIDTLPQTFELWYVNDGSTDGTESVVAEIIGQDPRVRLLNLSRNFGHQAALTAGLDFASGDAVITMDGDGQHPPACLVDMLDLYRRGFDVVLTQRADDSETGLFKRMTSRWFYRLLNWMTSTPVVPGAADFRLMSEQAVLSFRQVRETHRFIRGLVTWMGFRWTVLQFKPDRRIAGQSKYSLRKMLRLANDAVFSFGTAPIRLALFLGLCVLGLAFIEFLDPLVHILTGRTSELVPGWTTLLLSVLVLGATQLITLAILGRYVGLIYEEVKKRPLYLLRGSPVDQSTLRDGQDR
jgi:glycosyltransferase involved in cell wall biosynthesis